MSDAIWYYIDATGARVGPVTAQVIRDALDGHVASRTSLAWRDGLVGWRPLFELAEELGLAPQPQPPPPPVIGAGGAGFARGGPQASTSGERVIPAGFLRRWAALFLDQLVVGISLIVIGVIGVIVVLALGVDLDKDQTGLNWVGVLFYLVYFVAVGFYFAAMESSPWQATLGKRALGIKVVDRHGGRLSFGHALGRWFAAALSYLTLYVGFLMAAVTERKRALHDYVAGTEVVDQWAYTDQPERQKEGMSGCLVVFLIAALMVPIIAIFAAIAISQYQDYVIRAQVSEASSLADGVKTAVAEYVSNNSNSRFPESNDAAGLSSPAEIHGSYVSAVDIGGSPGRIDATFSSHTPFKANVVLDGKHIYFVGTIEGGSLVWRCESNDLVQKFCPASCQCIGHAGQGR